MSRMFLVTAIKKAAIVLGYGDQATADDIERAERAMRQAAEWCRKERQELQDRLQEAELVYEELQKPIG
jgi:predicted alpha/beta hydrolase